MIFPDTKYSDYIKAIYLKIYILISHVEIYCVCLFVYII